MRRHYSMPERHARQGTARVPLLAPGLAARPPTCGAIPPRARARFGPSHALTPSLLARPFLSARSRRVFRRLPTPAGRAPPHGLSRARARQDGHDRPRARRRARRLRAGAPAQPPGAGERLTSPWSRAAASRAFAPRGAWGRMAPSSRGTSSPPPPPFPPAHSPRAAAHPRLLARGAVPRAVPHRAPRRRRVRLMPPSRRPRPEQGLAGAPSPP